MPGGIDISFQEMGVCQRQNFQYKNNQKILFLEDFDAKKKSEQNKGQLQGTWIILVCFFDWLFRPYLFVFLFYYYWFSHQVIFQDCNCRLISLFCYTHLLEFLLFYQHFGWSRGGGTLKKMVYTLCLLTIPWAFYSVWLLLL